MPWTCKACCIYSSFCRQAVSQPVRGFFNCSAGLHLASASRDRTVAVWDLKLHQKLSVRRTGVIVSDMAWEPHAARLVCIGEEGSLFAWEQALPAGLLARSSPLDELADCAGDEEKDGGRTYSFDIGTLRLLHASHAFKRMACTALRDCIEMIPYFAVCMPEQTASVLLPPSCQGTC